MRRNKHLLTIVQCAMLLSVGLVFRYFSQMIPIGGVSGLRISVSGFFTKLPGILFGPLYGLIVSGLSDFLGWLIRPDEGAYIFPMTLTAALGGFIAGFVFKYVKNTVIKRSIKITYLLISLFIGLLGFANFVCVKIYPDSSFSIWLNELSEQRLSLLTYGMLACGIIGLLFYAINIVIQKLSNKPFSELYMKVFISLLAANIPVTTLNTFILRRFYDGLGKLPFAVVFLPRLIEEIVTTFVTAYVISYLYQLYLRIIKRSGTRI